MLRLIPLCMLPCAALAEGAVDRYSCEVMNCTGAACGEETSIDFALYPERIGADGTGSFTISFDSGDHLANLIAPQGPLVWTESERSVAFLFLPPDRSVFALHRFETQADVPDTATTYYLSCEVT